MMMFFVSLIAFISTSLLCVLFGQDLWQSKSFGEETEDRVTTCFLFVGLTCTVAITLLSLCHYAVPG